MSERPIQPDGMAQALAPSPAITPEMSRVAPIAPTPAPVEAAVPSLPPASQDADTTPPEPTTLPAPKRRGRNPDWKIPKNGIVRRKALAIVAMRANGYTPEQIAEELHISKDSIRIYLYRATKSGFLVDKKKGSLLNDPHERIEYDLAHKAVRNLEAMLDSDQMLERGQKSVKMEATLALANGVLFKKFDQAKETVMPTNVLQINIEGHQGKVDVTAGGTPLYTDGEVVSSGDDE